MTKELLPGIAAITTLLVVGAIYGRLHGASNGAIPALGDRVMAGFLALPLIAALTRAAFPVSHVAWALAAPLPLTFYVVLLAGNDLEWSWCKEKAFTRSLLIGVGVLYVLGGAIFWYQAV